MSRRDIAVVGPEGCEDFSGEVALLASDDLGHRFALCGATIRVFAGAVVVAEPYDHGGMQCLVGSSVPTAV